MAVGNEDIRDFLNRIADALDREAWDEFLSMCAPEFEYRVTAHSYELDGEMIWLIHDLDGLRRLFEVLPEQLGRRGTRMLRHVSAVGIEPGEADGRTVATSKVIAVRTSPEGRVGAVRGGALHRRRRCRRRNPPVDKAGNPARYPRARHRLPRADLGGGRVKWRMHSSNCSTDRSGRSGPVRTGGR